MFYQTYGMMRSLQNLSISSRKDISYISRVNFMTFPFIICYRFLVIQILLLMLTIFVVWLEKTLRDNWNCRRCIIRINALAFRWLNEGQSWQMPPYNFNICVSKDIKSSKCEKLIGIRFGRKSRNFNAHIDICGKTGQKHRPFAKTTLHTAVALFYISV